MKILNVVKEKLGQRYLQAVTVATVGAFPLVANAAEGAPLLDPVAIKDAVDNIGMAQLIGACVIAMLGVAVLIWGGKRVIGFFSK